MWSLYCWKQDDSSAQQPGKKSVGNVFDLLKNLFYLCMRANPWVLNHCNWWVEYPQSQKLKREQCRTRDAKSLIRLDCIDNKLRPNLLQEEEEVDPHLPHQNIREEQIQMIILWPASPVKLAGIGDAS